MIHKTVLLKEAIDGLSLSEGEVFLDATFGGGGHTKEVLSRFGGKVKIIAIDLYDISYKECQALSATNPNISCHKGNFCDLEKVLGETRPDAILFDLGWSSDELELSGRGFSFQKAEPLVMRYGDSGLTAAEIVNSWSEDELFKIFKEFGEERFASRIARGIVSARKEKRIITTKDLAEAIGASLPAGARHGRIHFATRVFQALRIAVNDELGGLSEALEKSFRFLKPGGRIAVISFHSLEDRIVKIFFKDREKSSEAKIVTKKPITPSELEINGNPRSRSAKLRIILKNKNG